MSANSTSINFCLICSKLHLKVCSENHVVVTAICCDLPHDTLLRMRISHLLSKLWQGENTPLLEAAVKSGLQHHALYFLQNWPWLIEKEDWFLQMGFSWHWRLTHHQQQLRGLLGHTGLDKVQLCFQAHALFRAGELDYTAVADLSLLQAKPGPRFVPLCCSPRCHLAQDLLPSSAGSPQHHHLPAALSLSVDLHLHLMQRHYRDASTAKPS